MRVDLSPRNPLTKVGGAIFEFDTICIPTSEIRYYFPIDTLHLSEIQNDRKSLFIERHLQRCGMLAVDMAAEREEYEFRIRRSYDL